MRTGLRFVLLVTLLTLSGCQLTLTGLFVPASVQVGQIFGVAVEADCDGLPGKAACVIQVPNGFTVVGHASRIVAAVTRDDPALLSLYTAEPGHYLASWSGSSPSPVFTLSFQVYVQAPANPTAGVIKVALAGQANANAPFVGQSPANVHDFAQILAPGNFRVVQVVADPPVDFVPDRIGMPELGSVGAWSAIGEIELCDWDGDGLDDLVGVGSTGVFVWRRSSGQWQAVHNALPGTNAVTALATGDFDGDGRLDLAIGDGLVYFGDGAGGWTAGPTLPLAGITLGVGVGDVDADGRDDIVFAGYYDEYLEVLLGNADCTFTVASNGLPDMPGLTVQEPLLVDVTGDGLVDLVAAEVWAGDGQGNWTRGSGIAAESWRTAVADLDGDGQVEIVKVGFHVAEVAVFAHVGNNQWQAVANTGLPMRACYSVEAADVDRDGLPDLVFGYLDKGLELWRNTGAITFQRVVDSGLPAATINATLDLTVGDFNGDSWPDLAAIVASEATYVWQNWNGGLSPFGNGCQGALPQPLRIDANGAPARGNAGFAVELAGGPSGTLALLWLGTSRQLWAGQPILPFALAPFGAPGCSILTGQDAGTWGTFDAQGRLSLPLPIPNDPALLRYPFFAQGAAYAAGGNALDLAFSAGLAVRVE